MVSAALALAAFERRPVADGDERILERRAPQMVRVDVAGRDRRDAQIGCEVAQERVPARVSALVRTLELDEEAVASERAREPGGGVRVADGEAVARAAGEADEAVVQLLEQGLVERRLSRRLGLLPGRPCMCVRCRDQPAEVRVALRRLDEDGDMGAVGEGELGAGDRADAEVLGRVRELERAVDAVVVGERERRIAELGCTDGQLLRQRGAVEERVRGVGVELDVRHRSPLRGARREPLLPASPVRKLGLELDGHTRGRWRASCSDRVRGSRSSAAGS